MEIKVKYIWEPFLFLFFRTITKLDFIDKIYYIISLNPPNAFLHIFTRAEADIFSQIYRSLKYNNFRSTYEYVSNDQNIETKNLNGVFW